MFDPDLIDTFPLDEQVSLRGAFTLISRSGIIESQIQRHAARLEEGSFDESDADLLNKLREYRRARASLLALKQMGES